MIAIWLVYFIALGDDVSILSKWVTLVTPPGWPNLAPFAIPLLETVIYLCWIFFWALKRQDIEHLVSSSDREAGPIVKLGAHLSNPSGAQLTRPFLPLILVSLALSAPMVASGDLRPSLWGLCLLWGATLGFPAVLPFLFRDRPPAYVGDETSLGNGRRGGSDKWPG